MRSLRIFMTAVWVALATACAGLHESPDFERHRFSQLWIPDRSDGVFYFDVMTPVRYPADDRQAEDVRMDWLAAWLASRKMCPGGFEVIRRRQFDYAEQNPARYDFRYEVKCRTGAAR